jgi:hypothetical protein
MAYSATEKSSQSPEPLAERDSKYFLELVVFQVRSRLSRMTATNQRIVG